MDRGVIALRYPQNSPAVPKFGVLKRKIELGVRWALTELCGADGVSCFPDTATEVDKGSNEAFVDIIYEKAG